MFREAIGAYRRDVEARSFPAEEESYHLPKQTREALEELAVESDGHSSKR
jgi:3-methyl-2-oxobutanoate hydroxymethyltransferase